MVEKEKQAYEGRRVQVGAFNHLSYDQCGQGCKIAFNWSLICIQCGKAEPANMQVFKPRGSVRELNNVGNGEGRLPDSREQDSAGAECPFSTPHLAPFWWRPVAAVHAAVQLL